MAKRKLERHSSDLSIAIPDGVKLTAASEQQWNRLVVSLPLERGPRLLFVTLDSPKLRRPLASDLAQKLTQAGVAIEIIDLTQPLAQPLQEILRQVRERTKASAYFVLGLNRSLLSTEHSSAAFADLNFHRERIPQSAKAPLVFWLDNSTFKSLALRSPDFMSWRAGEFHLIEDEGPMSEAIQRYRQHVIDRFSKLTLYSVTSEKPLAVDLEQVFVNVTIKKSSPEWSQVRVWRGAGSQPLLPSLRGLTSEETQRIYPGAVSVNFDALIAGTQSVKVLRPKLWEYVAQYVEHTVATRESGSFGDAMAKHRHISIIGAPGSGKTTALKYLALTFARRQAMERMGIDDDLVPIFVTLRDLSSFRVKNGWSPLSGPGDSAKLLLRYLDEFHLQHYPHLRLPVGFFRGHLFAGRCALLLDGLDEVADSNSRALVAFHVASFVGLIPGNRFLVSSRPRGYEDAGREFLYSRFAECTIKDFDDEQIKGYVKSWYRAVTLDTEGDTPTSRDHATTRAEDLLRAVQNDRVRPLATNPLLLSILALIHQRGNRLPQRRVALYEECVEFLLGFWRQVQGGAELAEIGGLTRNEKRALLEPIALWLHERGEAGAEVNRAELEQKLADEFSRLFSDPEKVAAQRATEFVDIIVEHAGLLVERESGVFAFSHLTFQEFLAARSLSDRPDYAGVVQTNLHNPWWREVILLLVGYISSPCTRRSRDDTSAILHTIRDAGSPLEEVLHRDLLFAFRCLCDVEQLGVDEGLRRSLATEVLELYAHTNNDAFRREVLDLFAYAGPTPVGRILTSPLFTLADNPKPNVRGVAVQAISAINAGEPSSEIIDRLIEASRDPKQLVIASAIEAMARLGGVAHSPKVIARLLEMIQEPSELAFQAAAALSTIEAGKGVTSIVLRLAELIRSPNLATGFAAISAIGRLRHEVPMPEIIEPLLELTKDDDANLRGRAVVALGRLCNVSSTSMILSRLIELTEDPDELVRAYVADAFGNIGTAVNRAEIKSGLFRLSEDRAFIVRLEATEALRKIADAVVSSDVRERLLEISRDLSGAVRAEAAAALGDLAAKGNIQGILARLIDLASDSEADVRVSATVALGKVRAESRAEVIPILLEKIQDDHPRVRRSAGSSLATLGLDGDASKVIAFLLRQTRSALVLVRATGAYTLGRIGVAAVTTRVYHRLVEMIRDPAKEVRSSASEALLTLGTSGVSKGLLSQMLVFLRSSKDYASRANVATALGQSSTRLNKQQLKQLVTFWTNCLRIELSGSVGGSYQKLSTVAYQQLKGLAASD